MTTEEILAALAAGRAKLVERGNAGEAIVYLDALATLFEHLAEEDA